MTEDNRATSQKLDQIGKDHNIIRNPGESDEAYAERIINVIDTRVQTLWEVQDNVCTLLVAAESSP